MVTNVGGREEFVDVDNLGAEMVVNDRCIVSDVDNLGTVAGVDRDVTVDTRLLLLGTVNGNVDEIDVEAVTVATAN